MHGQYGITRRVFAHGALALASAAATRGARAAEPFEWKRLNIYIGTTTGGGHDAYARLLGRHIGKHLPGNPTVVPVNRPGAGGLAMMNVLYANGAKDGTDIGVAAPGHAIDRVLYGDQSKAQFEAAKFNWIGSMAQESSVFVIRSAKSYTLQDVLAGKPMTVGMPGPGGGPWFYSRGLNALFGTKLNIISGYPGSSDVLLAIERGELDGVASTTWASLKATRQQWFDSGLAKVILQYSRQRMPDLPDVPTLGELMKDDQTRDIMSVISSLEVISRPVFAPPGIPPERVAALREAFDKTTRDEEFLAEAQKMKLPIQPLSGVEAQAIVAKISNPPQAIVQKVQEIFRE